MVSWTGVRGDRHGRAKIRIHSLEEYQSFFVLGGAFSLAVAQRVVDPTQNRLNALLLWVFSGNRMCLFDLRIFERSPWFEHKIYLNNPSMRGNEFDDASFEIRTRF